jgi:hypothetical protein
MLKGDNKPFHNCVHLSNTRWLARYNAVNTLLEHWGTFENPF